MSRQRSCAPFLVVIALAFVLAAGYLAYRWFTTDGVRTRNLMAWLRDPAAHPEWAIRTGQRCGEAPFLMPTDGFIGFLWGDSFRPGHHHQGLDIFGGGGLNQTEVIAVFPGYLSRLPEWKSSVIIRIPQDPLQPGRQVWTYYTHMADSAGNSYISPRFPPGSSEVYVEAGTLLGYQGNYSGDPYNPVGIHLHFSIVKGNGQGNFLNELEIQNTLDPSPYLGVPANAAQNQDQIPVCAAAETAGQ